MSIALSFNKGYSSASLKQQGYYEMSRAENIDYLIERINEQEWPNADYHRGVVSGLLLAKASITGDITEFIKFNEAEQ